MTTEDRTTDPREARLANLEAIEATGVDPYPARWSPDSVATELLETFEDDGDPIACKIAGRVVASRGHGKTTFAHVADRSGRIQAYFRKDDLGEDRYGLVQRLDLGDFIGVTGTLFRTRTGEVTVHASDVALLAKALRPLPFGKVVADGDEARAYHRVDDREYRYRRRYADLAVRPEARAIFERRADVIRFLRRFLDERGFLEVETPVLQPVYGGASARPFITHHNALDLPLYLRIADELYLKRCIVGGLERVYEVSKDFRNEGIDRFHSPEFTMLEFYQAYADYHDFMALAETMLRELVDTITGSSRLTYEGRNVDVGTDWPRLPFLEALENKGIETDDFSIETLRSHAVRAGLVVEPGATEGQLLDTLFSRLVEPDLEGPVFIIDHPRAISPLAKSHPEDPRLVERFEAYLFGTEWANAFSELNDPRDQRARFEDQAAMAAAGDPEAPNIVDEDFLRALEYGMPPTAGMGVGVDRLVMFLTDQASLRDVILFPALRPEDGRRSQTDDEGAS